ncbi:MAG: DnaB-like helicase C-terminal domain-containing protein [Myxococcota bacterium]
MGSRVGRRTRPRSSVAETLPLFASAMRQQAPADELVRVEDRPACLSTGLPSVDAKLRGGFPVGDASLVAARLKVGATSLLMGASLAALKRGEKVAYFSERLRDDQIRGRFVVLESRVNGYRFRAGFVTAEDRIALAAARERIPWSALSLVTGRRIMPKDIDGHLFSYRPWLAVVDVMPRATTHGDPRNISNLLEGVERLVSIARKHCVALVLRTVLPRGEHLPNRLELPGVGAMAEAFSSVILLHREEVTDPTGSSEDAAGRAEVHVVRTGGHDVEPRVVPLRFDQRFAGLLEL